MRTLSFIRLLIGFMALMQAAYSQASNGVCFSYDLNKPFVADYSGSHGYQLFGNIALTPQIVISPYVGYENLKGNLRRTGPYYADYIQRVDLMHLGVDGKYYFMNNFFAKAGALVYAAGGNEDVINFGIGGSAGAGISLPVNQHVRFEFSGFTNLIYIRPGNGHGLTPYGGIRAAISFDFGKPIIR